MEPEQLRIRPHVLRAVSRARAVVLDFDGVMVDVRTALGPQDARETAIADLLVSREHRPRPLAITAAARWL